MLVQQFCCDALVHNTGAFIPGQKWNTLNFHGTGRGEACIPKVVTGHYGAWQDQLTRRCEASLGWAFLLGNRMIAIPVGT